jgi:hypothetical protein
VGTKCDLPSEVAATEAMECAARHNVRYVECSSKTGEGVEEAVCRLTQQVLVARKAAESDAVAAAHVPTIAQATAEKQRCSVQ